MVQLPEPLSAAKPRAPQAEGERNSRTRLFAAGSALLLAALIVVGPIREAARLENELSQVADSYSESNAIRSALAILAHGWTANAGLPESTFGGLYPETGHWLKYRGKHHVDTHYPPGTTWLTAAMKIGCGQRPVSCLRALPIGVSALGAFALAFALMMSLGPLRGLAAALAAMAVPLYSNMMLGLHYQGYSLALLSIQLGAQLMLFSSGRELRARDLLLTAALAFLQGWLSFDYFFLVTLAPLPIAVLFSGASARDSRRRVVALVVAAGAGFALAHALHFLQVVAYYGDFAAAANDLFGVAFERTDPVQSLGPGEPLPWWASDPWMLSNVYLFLMSADEMNFDFRVGWALLAALLALIVVRGARFAVPGTGLRLAVQPSSRPAWTIVAALLVSCAWIGLMRGHAVTHPHFIPRHLFLAWLMMVLAVLHSVRLEGRPAANA